MNAASEIERMRAGLEAQQEDLDLWQSGHRQGLNQLREGFDHLLRCWQEFEERHAALVERVAAAEAERDQLLASQSGWEIAQQELQRATTELEGLRREEDELQITRSALSDASGELGRVQEQVAALNETVAAAEEQRAALEIERNEVRTELESRRIELEETSDALNEMRAEFEALLEERARLQAAAEEGSSARASLGQARARLEAEERRCKELEVEREKNLLAICDLRAQVNRLEDRIADASEAKREKVQKILNKVHTALDEAGAPSGEDLSFRSRIAWLRARIDDLGG